jgi:uncharacterized repeat protein (TIGR01451 family)
LTVTLTATPTATLPPSVEIGKIASEETVLSGDVVTYTLALTVTGSAASNVQVTDVLPDHLDFVRFVTVPSGGVPTWNPSTRTLGLSFPSPLAPGIHRLTYEARVDNSIQDGTVLINCADLTYSGWTGAPKRSCAEVELRGVYTVHVGVYNESGELVNEILVTRRSDRIEDFDITADLVIAGLNDPAIVVVDGVPLVTWNGDNRNGDPVSNGTYHLKIDNVDAYGVVHSVSQEITVSRSIAQVSVKVYNSAGEVVRELFTQMDDPCLPSTPCPNPLAGVQLSTRVLNPVVSGTPGPNQTLSVTSQSGLNIQWDGRSDEGQVVQNGHYELEVHYVDGRGASETVSLGVVVQGAGKGPLEDSVTVSSNLITGGASTGTITVARPELYDMKVSLYNVAGELVPNKTVRSSGTNQATFDLSGLSSGLYFAITDLYEAGTGRFVLRKTIKVAYRK